MASKPTVGLDPKQVRDLVVRPVLSLLGLPSLVIAEHLLMGTAAQESQFRYLKQIGGGPALGLWQMEPVTFRDLWERFGPRFSLGDLRQQKTSLAQKLDSLRVPLLVVPTDQLPWNLWLACAMCRVHYYARPFTLLDHASIEDLSLIWKEHYNTRLGKGRPSEFVRNYRNLVEPIYAAEGAQIRD